jgi:hypothetical protein
VHTTHVVLFSKVASFKRKGKYKRAPGFQERDFKCLLYSCFYSHPPFYASIIQGRRSPGSRSVGRTSLTTPGQLYRRSRSLEIKLLLYRTNKILL